MIDYGGALKWHREQAGLTQSELSKKTKLNQQTISLWETNKRIPSIDFCVVLADFYGITLDELIFRYVGWEVDRQVKE